VKVERRLRTPLQFQKTDWDKRERKIDRNHLYGKTGRHGKSEDGERVPEGKFRKKTSKGRRRDRRTSKKG